MALAASTLTACGGDEDAAASTQNATTVPAAVAPAPTTTAGPRSATLNWAAPTQYENGSPFVDLAGYRIWYGQAPGTYSRVVEIAPGTTSHNIQNLTATTYYFSISAYNHQGVESTLSNEITIRLN